MSKPTVCAVVRATIEIPVRPSEAGETLEELYRVAQREAEAILQSKLPKDFRVIGKVEFSHAVVMEPQYAKR